MNKFPMVFIIQQSLQKQEILTDSLELAGITPVYAYVAHSSSVIKMGPFMALS